MLKNFLQGKWLGHPLHAALVHVPVGGWLVACALDVSVWVGSPASVAGDERLRLFLAYRLPGDVTLVKNRYSALAHGASTLERVQSAPGVDVVERAQLVVAEEIDLFFRFLRPRTAIEEPVQQRHDEQRAERGGDEATCDCNGDGAHTYVYCWSLVICERIGSGPAA